MKLKPLDMTAALEEIENHFGKVTRQTITEYILDDIQAISTGAFKYKYPIEQIRIEIELYDRLIKYINTPPWEEESRD